MGARRDAGSPAQPRCLSPYIGPLARWLAKACLANVAWPRLAWRQCDAQALLAACLAEAGMVACMGLLPGGSVKHKFSKIARRAFHVRMAVCVPACLHACVCVNNRCKDVNKRCTKSCFFVSFCLFIDFRKCAHKWLKTCLTFLFIFHKCFVSPHKCLVSD